MVYDAIEAAYTVVLANIATDLAALVAAKSVTGVDATVNVVKRQSAEIFVGLGMALPAVGIWALDVATQGRSGWTGTQGQRDNESTLVLDYYAESPDPVAVAKQTELAAEALLLSIDKMIPGTGGVFGNGELPGSIRIKLTDGFAETKATAAGRNYWRRAQITFPLYDRDTV